MSGGMGFRYVRRVLAVGSAWDTCLLTERVLASAWARVHGGWRSDPPVFPRLANAATGAAALSRLATDSVDLVIAVPPLPDMAAAELAGRLAQAAPTTPLLVLATHPRDLPGLAEAGASDIPCCVLLWRGDPATVLAGIELEEDLRAVEAAPAGDGGEPVLLLVEDDAIALSGMLPHLYGELRRRSAAVGPGQPSAAELVRPRLLAAASFEQALALWRRYADRVAGVVTDGEFPRNGRPDPDAGAALIREVRLTTATLPVLMQSAEPNNAAAAAAGDAGFLLKGSPGFLTGLRGWMAQFRDPTVDPRIPPRASAPRRSGRAGFAGISLLGSGSPGPKGRGLAFAHAILAESAPDVPGGSVAVPPTLVLAGDVAEEYFHHNHLEGMARGGEESANDVLDLLRRGEFSPGLLDDLRAVLRSARGPLAVRPSNPCLGRLSGRSTGGSATVMLPNTHASLEVRLVQLLEAVRVVWAGAFLAASGLDGPDQSPGAGAACAAVAIQRLVGSPHGSYFFPALSGWAFSHNEYPFNAMRPEDGVATVMVGWGRSGEEGVRFCPASPGVLPQFSSVKDALRNAQRRLWALDMARAEVIPDLPAGANLAFLDVHQVLDAPWAAQVASTYIKANDTVVDRMTANGVSIVTFNRILKGRGFPLARLLQWLLTKLEREMGAPVEVGFAADLATPGPPLLQVVHVRPMVWDQQPAAKVLAADAAQPALVRSPAAMGPSGCVPVQDLLLVLPDLPRARTAEAAAVLEELNRRLVREGRSYVLIGPGRWGTRDPWLGIPVSWSQISGARAIVETDFADLEIEPSQGSHFFHQLTAAGVVFLPVHPRGVGGSIDWSRLQAEPPAAKAMGGLVRHLRPAAPPQVVVDGASRRGVVLAGDPP